MLCIDQVQSAPLAFITGRKPEPQSQGLQLIHDVAQWWLRLQIGRQCRYSVRMMKRLGCFDELITDFLRTHTAAKSIEDLSADFLRTLLNHKDPVLRAVAHLELACLQPIDPFTPSGARTRVITIRWDRNPNHVMDALERFDDLPEPEAGVRYVLRMGADLPNGVTCVRQMLRA